MSDFYSQPPAPAPAPTANLSQDVAGLKFEGQTGNNYPPNNMSSASSYANLGFLYGVQDPAIIAPKGSRNRRKPAHGSENVKHRRTRSGCYTCRSRRVKCDETHPICERCRKGGRECVYPEKPISTKPSANKISQTVAHESPDSSSEEYEDEDDVDKLKAIPDEDESMTDSQQLRGHSKSDIRRVSTGQSLSRQKSFTRPGSETPSLVQDKGPSPSPSTEGSIGYPNYSLGTLTTPRGQIANFTPERGGLMNDWSHLPHDLQFYLSYFCENMTVNHFAIKHDSGDFLRTDFLDAALRNEALLYAVVGFSAFQYTLTNPRGRIQDFLQYYNKAVSLLLRTLTKGGRHNIGILLTMLQLASVEEYLGDWINLLGHQKAAYEILKELYTPETVLQSQVTRMLFGWYARFDVFAGLMGGFETVLSREWFSGAQDYFTKQINEDPNNINWKIEEAISCIRLVAMDMSNLFAKKGKGEISHEQFLVENEVLSKRILNWRDKMDPALRDPQWRVTDFTGAPPADPNDIVDPFIPGTLYHGPLWSMNKAMIDWYSIDLMHRYQTAVTLGNQPSKELAMGAYATCQLFEAIQYWPHSPKGSIIACQASLGIASLFLPRDKMHSMWCRRKLALVESLGYIYPLTFRTKMSALFQDPTCMQWWLPNDESYPSIIRSIRKFAMERTSEARDVPAEDLRDMKAIFASLKLDDGKTHIPVPRPKTMMSQGTVAVASDQGWRSAEMISENVVDIKSVGTDETDSYNLLDYPESTDYWST